MIFRKRQDKLGKNIKNTFMVGGRGGGRGKDSKDKGGWGGGEETFLTAQKKVVIFT
jgi:hypothetical protein